MECRICYELFDALERRPKVLPCGHTVCIGCLDLDLEHCHCPLCRQEWKDLGKLLPDNLAVLDLLRQQQQQRGPTGAWCTDCGASPVSGCQGGGHAVRSARAALRLKLLDLVPRVTEALESLQDFQDLGEHQALAALRLLAAPTAPGDVVLNFGKDAIVVQSKEEKDPLLFTLVLALAAKGRLCDDDAPQKKVAVGEGEDDGEVPASAVTASIPGLDFDDVTKCDGRKLSASDSAKREAVMNQVRHRGVLLMSMVRCDADPAWSLNLLRNAAPLVEELHLCCPAWDHLAVLCQMPRLRRLFVWGDCPSGDAPAPAVNKIRLQFLRVEGTRSLPRALLTFLLKAFGPRIEQLVLEVGTPGDTVDVCVDLHSLLGRWNLQSLRRLVFLRHNEDGGGTKTPEHVEGFCRDQLDAVRRLLSLSRLGIFCEICHKIPREYEVEQIKIENVKPKEDPPARTPYLAGLLFSRLNID